MTKHDPVHKDEKGWWFYDETWAARLGPWETEEIARSMLDTYVRTELHHTQRDIYKNGQS